MLNRLSHHQVRERLDAIFVGDDVEGVFTLREHLKGCRSCRGYFHQLAAMDKALLEPGVSVADESPRRSTPGVCVGSAVESDGDESLGDNGGTSAPKEVPQRQASAVQTFAARYSDLVMRAAAQNGGHPVSRSLWRTVAAVLADTLKGRWWVLAGAVGVVVGLLSFALWSPGNEPVTDDNLTPRTATGSTAVHRGVHQLELLCVVSSGDGKVVFREADSRTGVLSCHLKDEIKFVYLNKAAATGQRLSQLTIVGRDQDGRLFWYEPVAPPADEDVASVDIDEASRLTGHGETVRVAAIHEPGVVHVYGVFTAVPIKRAVLSERLVQRSPPSGDWAAILDGLALRTEDGTTVRMGTKGLGEYVVRHRVLAVESD